MANKTRAARRANVARRKQAAEKQRPRTAGEEAKARGDRAARLARTYWTHGRVLAYYAAWNRTGRPPQPGAELLG